MPLSNLPYRWKVVGLLFLLSVLNYLDRQALSILAPTLQAKLGFSSIGYSYIVTSFLIAYGVGNLLCGPLVDRMGVRTAVVLALALWSAAAMAHALVAGLVGLVVLRFLLGLGESFGTPCGMKGVAEWIPKRERGLCTAVISNGYMVGAILAPPIVSFAALRFGWRWAFAATGGMGLLVLALWLRYYDTPERQRRLRPAERDRILQGRGEKTVFPRVSLGRALRNRAGIGFIVARLLTDSFSYFFAFWLPEYLHASHGFTLAMIGLFAWTPFVASDIGGPTGGAVSDWLVRRGWNTAAARRRLLLISACVMPLSLVAVRVGSAAVALVLIGVLLASQSSWNTNLLTMMSESFPREQVGTYVAISGAGGSIGGVCSTLLAGRTIHAVGYGPVFTALGFLHLAALGVLALAFGRATGGRMLRKAQPG